MTLNELVFNLANIIRGGRRSDDDPIDNRQIVFIINYIRGLLMRRAIKDKSDPLRNSMQTIKCIDMVCMDKSLCCEINTDYPIIQNKLPIPKLVDSNNAIYYVGLVDGERAFNISSYSQARWSKYAKFTSNATRAYWVDNRTIRVVNQNLLEFISIIGIFENPLEVPVYDKCNKCTEFDWDAPYPIESWMIMELQRLILDKELRILALTTTDQENDARQTPTTGVPS